MYHTRLISALLVSFPLFAGAAPVMYVTDRVPVALHGANDPASPTVKQVVSGAPLEVQERDGALFKVRTEDGSVGWIDPDLLSNEKPLQHLYLELRSQLGKAQDELKTLRDKGAAATAPLARDESKVVADLRAELKGSHDRVAELERVARDTSAQLSDATTQLAALETENTALRNSSDTPPPEAAAPAAAMDPAPADAAAMSNKKTLISLPWFLASAFLVLLLGAASGAYAVDLYIRKRHGGFRIY